MQKQKQEEGREREGESREREKVTKSLGAFFFPHLGRTFPLRKPLNRR